MFGDQQEARNIEKGHTPGKTNVYQLNSPEEETKPYIEAKRDKEKIEIAADGETKKVYLDDMPDRAVTIGAHLTPEEQNELIRFLKKNKDVSPSQPKTCKVLTETSSSTLSKQMRRYPQRSKGSGKCLKKK
jgi:hypothetical protein